jgi:hypothetical protein
MMQDWPVFSNALLITALVFFLVAYERITSPRYATDIVAPFTALLHDPTTPHWRAFGSALFHWAVYYLPTAMNLAWLLLASCINISSVAVQLGWVGFTAPALPVGLIMMADVVALSFAGQPRYPDATVPLVVVWGLSAVIVNSKTTPEILTACWVSVGVVGYTALVALAAATAGQRSTEHYRAERLHSCNGIVNHECSPLLTAP